MISFLAVRPLMSRVADLISTGAKYGDVVEYVALNKTVGLRDASELARIYLRLLANEGNDAAYRLLATA